MQSDVANQLIRSEKAMATIATATEKPEKKQQPVQPKGEQKPQRAHPDAAGFGRPGPARDRGPRRADEFC